MNVVALSSRFGSFATYFVGDPCFQNPTARLSFYIQTLVATPYHIPIQSHAISEPYALYPNPISHIQTLVVGIEVW